MRVSRAEHDALVEQLARELVSMVVPLKAERDEWKRRAINAEDQLARIGRRAPERMRP